MKVIIIDTPKGQFSLPLKPVAEHRADFYACEVDGNEKGSEEWQDEVDFVMNDSYEAIDWLLNNNDWDEWKEQAIQINESINVTDDDFWHSSDNMEIKDNENLVQ